MAKIAADTPEQGAPAEPSSYQDVAPSRSYLTRFAAVTLDRLTLSPLLPGLRSERTGVPPFVCVTAGRLPSVAGDALADRIVREYGAIYVARGVVLPPWVVFPDAASTAAWQATVAVAETKIDKTMVRLQAPALSALVAARAEARALGRDITPTGGNAAMRSYADGEHVWKKRVEPALLHWVKRGVLDTAAAERIRGLGPREQTIAVLGLEAQGYFFSTGRDKSILRSGAAPGTSQHLALLALDVTQYADPEVRRILAQHGWHRTVIDDLRHFTYLGVGEDELPCLGLRRVDRGGHTYWVPDLEPGALSGTPGVG